MMQCRIYPAGTFPDCKYVVIFSRYCGELLLSRHRDRLTWETQGGHIEPGETPLQAAYRELYEESGALESGLSHVFDYCVTDAGGTGTGAVFFEYSAAILLRLSGTASGFAVTSYILSHSLPLHSIYRVYYTSFRQIKQACSQNIPFKLR